MLGCASASPPVVISVSAAGDLPGQPVLLMEEIRKPPRELSCWLRGDRVKL